MKQRGIGFQIFGVLMLFVSNSLAVERPTLYEVLQKIEELEDLIRQSYAISPSRSKQPSPTIYGELDRNTWGDDDFLDDLIISPGFNIVKRGVRSSNSNANMNLISRDSSRYSSGSRDDDDTDDSVIDPLGLRGRLLKIRRRPRVTRIQGRNLKKHIITPYKIYRNKLRYVTYPSTGRYSSNRNQLTVRTIRNPRGSRSLGGSRNYNSNINSNVNENVNSNVNDNLNMNEKDDNFDRHININEIDDEELDY